MPKVRGRELAKFGANRRVVEMVTPLRDKNEGAYWGLEGTTLVIMGCPEGR